MCFSTTASFIAGTTLTIIGIAAIKKTQVPSQLMFASIPLIFAIQQFSEGFVWLSLLDSKDLQLQQLAINTFLWIALFIWPAWIPISFYLIEKIKIKKQLLGVVAVFGILFSILSTYYFLTYESGAKITPYHIHYELEIPNKIKAIFGILYLIPTVISHFISSLKRIKIMGVFVLASYLITILVFNDTVLSVWCFFSAAISAMIYSIIVGEPALVIIKPIYTSIKSSRN
jgi:hypothetical protein